MIMVTVAELEEAFYPDNWLNPKNFDPVKIAEAEKALKELKETIRKE
jgi:hypothetical protein